MTSSRRNFSIWAQLFCRLRVVGIGAKVGCVQSKHLTTHVRSERPFRLGQLVCLEETMNRTIRYVLAAVASVFWVGGIHGQDLLVPAGTLLQCTLSEPNFSSATASVGDPVLCHLKSFQEFGRTVFPRGSMLAGHLEAEKDPGHFIGKGYLEITFDRVILPSGDFPVPAKVIQAKGFKVDKKGDIDGKGHAKRDVAEWMIPPLWPWKVVSLPRRGPRPTLKGEEPLELRLMEDISIPRTLANGLVKPDGSPYGSLVHPSNLTGSENSGESLLPIRYMILVLKSNETFTVRKFRKDGDLLTFEQLDGTRGAVDLDQLDWRKTNEMNRIRSVGIAEIQAN